MKIVVLTDGTRIEGCSDSTTVNSVLAVRETYEAAGAVRDLFTDENSGAIRILNSDGTEYTTGSGLKLLDDAALRATVDGVICEISLRNKTEIEILQDQIAELQEAIIEE